MINKYLTEMHLHTKETRIAVKCRRRKQLKAIYLSDIIQ